MDAHTDARRYLAAAQNHLEGQPRDGATPGDLALISIASSLVDLSLSLRADASALRAHPASGTPRRLRSVADRTADAVADGRHPEPLWLDEG